MKFSRSGYSRRIRVLRGGAPAVVSFARQKAPDLGKVTRSFDSMIQRALWQRRGDAAVGVAPIVGWDFG
jgi:hypothetical protein